MTATRQHLARLLKYYPRPPCAPCLIKSRFFWHITNLLTVLTFLHFEIPYMYTCGESQGASSGFGLWAKTLRGQIYLLKNIACAIGAMKRIRHLTLYNGLIQPHIYYCNVVWGNRKRGLSKEPQKLQSRAARILNVCKL